MRFAAANGYWGIPAFAKRLKVKPIVLLCADPTTIATNPMEITVPEQQAKKWIRNPSAYGRSWSARVCPMCMKEDDTFSRAAWDHPLQLRCVEHECLLVDQCTTCGTRVRHDRPHLGKCACGQVFSDISPKRVPAWVMAMEMAFFEAFHSPQQAFGDISTQLARNAARVLDNFSACQDDASKYRGRGTRENNPIVLSSSYESLDRCFRESWTGMPHNYQQEMTADTTEGYHRVQQTFTKFRRIDAFADKIRAQAGRPNKNPARIRVALRDSHRRLAELSPLTGYASHELKAFAAEGLLEGIHLDVCGKTEKIQYLVDRRRFAEIKKDCEKHPTLPMVAKRLNVSVETVKHLIERHILCCASDRPAYMRRTVSDDDLFDFACFLGGCADFETELPSHRRLTLTSVVEDAMRLNPQAGATKVFDALTAGEIFLHTATSQPNTLGDYYFDRPTFSAWCCRAFPT